ncbi:MULTISPECIES: hypothetical protein [unclassified Mesorhizobium]|uniref:hypothetical protein n=1 Tax=unclassified Mesorhizobium TaxID=325217 RepID=UPI000FCC16C0|nr:MULTISPECIES: hypothetical protein [unclassified Mesorhizobium]TGP26312.1 hypothetical protein EN874_001115 [Mesorhizobium sp. M1D.F.Ca.ET.231.01.1.1]TGP38270.1 hypothetical protein EN877_01115 [Mesorhizobium sp. M1D.F.Ca.ET.234.01.1.1]TGS50481.1 hypothetical protein EN827_01115 [Mesorhizobium sp. M1D.F.Ca.ET.184.01.1.1]TGS66367.1 hypothetical protein EN826_001115 [Mesorhizobium sp. M1D.F.Ca.ET.183.01.1.1]
MVRKLQVPVIAAGGAAIVAEDDLDQIAMQAGLIGAEPLNQFRNVKRCLLLACEAVDRQAVPASSFLPSVSSVKGRHGDPREMGAPHRGGLYS